MSTRSALSVKNATKRFGGLIAVSGMSFEIAEHEVLGLIGSIAPMLGLTGTVLGMIRAFNTIASTEGAATPTQLASGISQALVTTLMGLVVAIPTMIASLRAATSEE